MSVTRIIHLIFLTLLMSLVLAAGAVSAQEPVIRAVLLYSPSCPHCMEVINEILPPLVDKYGSSQLQIFGVNTYTETGNTLFNNTVEKFSIPEERQAVPTLIVGERILVGSNEIAESFPGIIEQGLTEGGIDGQAIPGLQEAMINSNQEDEEHTAPTNHALSLGERFRADLVGNVFSVLVLAGMVGSLVYSGITIWNGNQANTIPPASWLIPLLSLIGIGVAGYLSYVEYNQVEAVCGPVGDCNTVQQSSYAKLFGIIPVGFLGILGYITLIILWLIESLDLPALRNLPILLSWGITLLGTLFSFYLTFLEPFVIGATCMWCLTSAILMTVLYLLATRKLTISMANPVEYK